MTASENSTRLSSRYVFRPPFQYPLRSLELSRLVSYHSSKEEEATSLEVSRYVKYKKGSYLGITGGSICMDLLTADGESSFFLNQLKMKWIAKGWLPSYRYVVFQTGLTYDC